MKFHAHITVMPLAELLDPQGKAVNNSLHNLGLDGIDNVRIGKHVTMVVNAKDEAEAGEVVSQACKKLLHNAVMESYSFQLHPAD